MKYKGNQKIFLYFFVNLCALSVLVVKMYSPWNSFTPRPQCWI